MKKLYSKYPYIFVKIKDWEVENGKKITRYGEKLGAKSDLLYRATIQLNEKIERLEDEIQLLKVT